MRDALTGGVSGRALVLLAVFFALLAALPFFVGDYPLTILITMLYFAYAGQAWNIMMGFAGLLSLGHALYIGLGAYAAAALFTQFGISPWIGLLVAVPVAMIGGAVIGFLAFRFRVAGVYFAILTIAFAEFARIGFDHLSVVGGSGGLFLPVKQFTENDLWNLRGSPVMFYYLILAMTVAALIFSRVLLASRIGFYWRAIREDEEAALALGVRVFRYKMYAVVISAGMTAVAGVFFAFYYNNLFPEQVFHISRSIEVLLAPMIGGVGTLFGPIVGTFIVEGLAEGLRELLAFFGIDLPGAKQIFFGLSLAFVIIAAPEGVWPWLARRLGLTRRDR